MKFVEPIREMEKVVEVMETMLKDGKERLALLFWTGVYTGLRISDILSLTFEDFRKDVIYITEQKTGKEKKIVWNKDVKELFNQIDDRGKTGLIFKSNSNRVKAKNQAWSTVYTGKEIKFYCEAVGLKGRYNNHSLRKTYAYTQYKISNYDIYLVQRLLNHSKVETTYRYLGVYKEEAEKANDTISYFKTA